jgi:CheY-like chemotaxis protein
MKNNYIIKSLLCVEDDIFYSYLFKDAAESTDLALQTKILKSSDEAETYFRETKDNEYRPDCIFVDVNLDGSSFNGLELIRKINFEYGNNVVIGVISTSNDDHEKAIAVKNGAQFWILKDTIDLEKVLLDFKKDFQFFLNRTINFKVYQ